MDDMQYYRRQGFWLRMSRERAGKNQAGAAEKLGLSKTSKSTVSDYENGTQVAPQPVLRKLARFYAVPVELFLDPPPTAEEMIEARMAELADGAADAERRDWAAGRGPSPASEHGSDAEPDRRSA